MELSADMFSIAIDDRPFEHGEKSELSFYLGRIEIGDFVEEFEMLDHSWHREDYVAQAP